MSADLPRGWTIATLGSVSREVRNGISAKPSALEGLPILRISSVRPLKLDATDVRYLPVDFEGAETYQLAPDDLLFTRYNGNRELVGVCARVGKMSHRLVYPDKLIRVRLDLSVALPSYVEKAANSQAARAYLDQKLKTSAGQIGVSGADIKAMPMALPPLPEQKRIADKLDTVLTRVDAVSTRLARVAPLLKRFRQSVLAAATSGRLTSEWRESNAVHQPWRDMTLGSLIEDMRNGLATKPDESPAGKKILRISAVRPGVLDTTDHRYLTADEVDAKIYNLRKGDLLFTRYNGSLEFVGVCALVSEDLPEYVYPDKLIRVRANTAVVLPKFIEIASAEVEARAQIEGFVKSSAGQKGISGSNLKSLRLSVPPLEEQTEIVRRVDTLFAFADRLEVRLKAAEAVAGRLTPALLAKAFRGELVPQDPDDEPASELLRRLQAASGHRAPARAAGRGRKRSI